MESRILFYTITEEQSWINSEEIENIVKTPQGAAVDNDGQPIPINAESYASMNMWGLTPV